MPRIVRRKTTDHAEALFKLVAALVVLVVVGFVGLKRFTKIFLPGLEILMLLTVVAVLLWLIARMIALRWGGRSQAPSSTSDSGVNEAVAVRFGEKVEAPAVADTVTTGPRMPWTAPAIHSALGEIDWYQFEKFCAALLRTEGYQVKRRGGATPDGGVDLLARKNGGAILVQCKHWRTWVVQEKTIREMLGSMTHFKVMRGTIYTLKGWTAAAAEFAALHQIDLVDGNELSRRAAVRLAPDHLDELLHARGHRCPRCESEMVLRAGNFATFWGCSQFPRCRHVLKDPGAK